MARIVAAQILQVKNFNKNSLHLEHAINSGSFLLLRVNPADFTLTHPILARHFAQTEVDLEICIERISSLFQNNSLVQNHCTNDLWFQIVIQKLPHIITNLILNPNVNFDYIKAMQD